MVRWTGLAMVRWTGLAPWEFELPFPGSLISTFLMDAARKVDARLPKRFVASAFCSKHLPV